MQGSTTGYSLRVVRIAALSVSIFGITTMSMAQVVEQDSLALVAFYDATNGPVWGQGTSWLTGPVSGWKFVTVTGNRVTELVTSDFRIVGELPSEMRDLTALTSLVMPSGQGISGAVPAWLGELTELIVLELSGNKFTGSIPPELGNLAKLERLKLGGNDLTGLIPSEIGALTKLRKLDFTSNELSGSIPPEFSNLTSLTHLILRNNNLTGPIPAGLSNLTQLFRLDLDTNELSGQVPAELGSIFSLRELRLGHNQLTGSIPNTLAGLTNLTVLTLAENQMTGELPVWLADLTELAGLGLFGNSFSGTIPPELGSLRKIHDINLGGNQLTGPIPAELGNIASLNGLDLSGNQLTGPIPSALAKPVLLDILVLSSNNLSGNIPMELGDLLVLFVLKVDNNPLMEGALPSNLTNLNQMERFWFDGTNLCETSDATFQDWIRNINDLRTTGCIVSDKETLQVPGEFMLEANYPEPFNTSTTISYSLSRPGRVQLHIYNMIGELVQTVDDRLVPAGEYTTSFSASGLSSGIYVYRLTVGEHSETRTMTVMN